LFLLEKRELKSHKEASMRPYETAFLIAPNLPEEEAEKLIEKMAGIITKKKGKMINTDKWGKRKLAYPIKSFEEALYVFFQYEGEPSVPTELERNFKQTEGVIRYLTIKLEERENIHRKKKTKPRAAAEEEREKSAPYEKTSAEEPEAVEEAPSEVAAEEKPVEEIQKKAEEKEEERVAPEKAEEESPPKEAEDEKSSAKEKED
jgi:small subunit ribosomal protein S6